jgi:hypothetical protein
MRFSKSYKEKEKNNFFEPKKLLSEKQVQFFILEEALLLFLIIIQIQRILSFETTYSSLLFSSKVLAPNIYWLIGSIAFFIIGYVVIACRDTSVQLIHKNLFKVLFIEAEDRILNANKKLTLFVIAEVVYAFIIAMSIYIYLDPELNLVPTPYNYVGFVVLLGIGLLLFSHTKQFREVVYGPTYVQQKLHLGRHEIKRFTNPKTGSIRVAPKNHYKHKLIR